MTYVGRHRAPTPDAIDHLCGVVGLFLLLSPSLILGGFAVAVAVQTGAL